MNNPDADNCHQCDADIDRSYALHRDGHYFCSTYCYLDWCEDFIAEEMDEQP